MWCEWSFGVSSRSNSDLAPPSIARSILGRIVLRRARLPLLGLAMMALIATALFFVDSSGQPAHAQGYDANCSALPSDAVTPDLVTEWRDDLSSSATAGIKRFNRVLERLGVDTETNASAMTTAQAEAVARWLRNDRWDRIARTMAALDDCDTTTPPPSDPAVSISGGSDITEGANASFTLTATPAPSANLNVSVTVTQSGDFASTGTQTVTISSTGSATFIVATSDDSADEADGSVTTTVNSGNGYTVSASSSATVKVADNDVPAVSISGGNAITEGGDATFTLTASPAPHAALSVSVSVTQSGNFATTGTQTVSIGTTGSATLTVSTDDDSIDEANGSVTATVNSGSGYSVGSPSAATVSVADNDVAQQDQDDDDTIVSCLPSDAVSATEVTGWRDALDPVAGAHGVRRFNRVLKALGVDTKTNERTMSYLEAREISGRLGNNRWDRISRTLTAMQRDNCDDTPTTPTAVPEISISAGNDVTEGTDATFTLTADPAPSADLDVTVSVTQSGDFATTGTQTVTITSSGSATLTVSTDDDSVDEPDGSVTATVDAGSGYTVSSSDGAATVDVSDDDAAAAVPEISIAAGNDVTEGGDATFTVTADPAPAATLTILVNVTQSGDFTSGTGSRYVDIPTGGSATVTVATDDDSKDEADGSVTAVVPPGNGYTVSTTQRTATVAVADNDDAPKKASNVKPDVSVTAGSDIVEGEDATFTVTADPAPAANLRVLLSVKQQGNYALQWGARYFTIPTSGSATLTVRTLNDSADEADGSISATIIYNGRHYNVGSPWQATLNVSDNDGAYVDSRTPRTDITWADFWAPYEELIADIDAVRNDKVRSISESHTDFWDSVLLAFGRDVDDEYLTPMNVAGAKIYASRNVELFDRIAPALEEIWDNGPPPVNPGDAPEQTTEFPGHIAITGGATSKTFTLTDYFEDPEDEDLIFTIDFSGTTMTATLSGVDLTLSLIDGLSRGGGDLTITASDGQLTDTATAHVVVGCGTSSSWDERWGFCLAAATSNSFSGAAEGDAPNSADFNTGSHTAQVTKLEGESGSIAVRVFPDVLSDSNAGNNGTCGMRGYLSFQDANGTEISNTNSMETGTWSVRVTGAGFVNSPLKASNRAGTDNVAGFRLPGWEDTSCGNDALTTHKHRLVIVEYNIPVDELPGTTLTGVKLMYHDLGSSGTITQASHELMAVNIKDTISEVSIDRLSGIQATRTIGEGTGPGSSNLILASDDRLVGYVAVVVDGAEPNERPDLTQTSSNPQHGWWAEITTINREAYFNPTIWAHLNSGLLPKWSSSGTYDVNTGVWHNDAVWVRSATADYDAGDEPGGSNNGWAPLTRSGNTFTTGRAGSNNGSGRDAPASVPAWTPDGNYGHDATAHTFVWNEHDTKLYVRENKDIGVFTPVDNFEEQMLAAYRDNGPAMQINLRLSGGSTWPWLDQQDCMFNTHTAGGSVDTCTLSWNWPDNGYFQNEQKLELWWVELESFDANAPVKYRTKLSTISMRDSGTTGPGAHTGRYWVEFQSANGTYSATTTQPLSETHPDYTNRRDRVRGYIVTNQDPIVNGGNNDRVVAVEVRRGTTRTGALSSFKQPLNKYVGRGAFTIDGQAHREFYLLGTRPVPCNESGYEYSCFGGEGNWTKVSGRSIWRTPFNLVVHDDNYVAEMLRYYVFTVKDSTSGYVPTLEVKEDDWLQITLKADLAVSGKLNIHSHRASYQHYSFRLEERGSVDGEAGWDKWDVTIERDWHGFASSYHLGDDTKGVDEHPGCPAGGGDGWVRAVFENWDGLFLGVDFNPDSKSTDHDYQPDTTTTSYSGWVQVCKKPSNQS